jgi:hypothetical protein
MTQIKLYKHFIKTDYRGIRTKINKYVKPISKKQKKKAH